MDDVSGGRGGEGVCVGGSQGVVFSCDNGKGHTRKKDRKRAIEKG